MKTITIEHEAESFEIRYDNLVMDNKYILKIHITTGDTITKRFKTFDEAVEYVRKELL